MTALSVTSSHHQFKHLQQPTPPDGGWGWFIVLASFIVHFLTDGIAYTIGIFYHEFATYFRSSKAATAWVASILTGIAYGIGPIVSGLTNKYGCRTITIIGGLLSCIGFLLSIFSPSITYVAITIGIVTGSGFGLLYLPAIVMVTCYFDKRRAFATGIAVCGSGIGSAVFALLNEWLIHIYGWKGTMFIISGLVLNCCIAGLLFRPLENTHTKCNDKKRNKSHSSVSIHSIGVLDNNNKVDVNETDTTCIDSTNAIECLINNDECDYHVKSDHDNHQLSHRNTCASVKPNANNKNSDIHYIEEQPKQKICINKLNEVNEEEMVKKDTLTERNNNNDNNNNLIVLKGQSTNPDILDRKDIFNCDSLTNLPVQCKSNPIILEKDENNICNNSPKIENFEKAKTDTHNNFNIKKLTKNCYFCSKEMRDNVMKMMDLRLLKNYIFLLFSISNLLTSLGFNVPHIYIKARSVGLKIVSDNETSHFIAITGLASSFGRVLFGFISDLPIFNRLWIYNICLTICGLSTMLSSYARTYYTMALYCGIFGFTCGACVSLTSVILVDILGLELLTNAFGLLLLFQGLASLLGPPIAGWLYDITDSYDPGFFWAGSMIAISGLILFFIPSYNGNISAVEKIEQKQQNFKAPIVVIENVDNVI